MINSHICLQQGTAWSRSLEARPHCSWGSKENLSGEPEWFRQSNWGARGSAGGTSPWPTAAGCSKNYLGGLRWTCWGNGKSPLYEADHLKFWFRISGGTGEEGSLRERWIHSVAHLPKPQISHPSSGVFLMTWSGCCSSCPLAFVDVLCHLQASSTTAVLSDNCRLPQWSLSLDAMLSSLGSVQTMLVARGDALSCPTLGMMPQAYAG